MFQVGFLRAIALKLGMASLIALSLSGCTSGYAQFYQPTSNNTRIQFLRFSGTPSLISSSGDQEADAAAAFTLGLGAVGFASFNGPQEGIEGAIAQAKKVGASHVLISAKYAQTVSGVLPLVTPQTYTSVTTGRVSAAGAGGFASANYSGTTTTTSNSTTFVPYSVERYDQQAVFLAPLERRGIGIKIAPLSAEQIRAAGTNKAVLVEAVRRGSPAFMMDVFPGDMLVEVNDAVVFDSDSFSHALNYDAPIKLRFRRGAEEFTKTINLPAGGAWQ